MQRFLATLITLVWGLWFGGLMTLFIAVQSLFSTFGDQQRSIAGFGAAGVFHRFELFQLVLAATALISTLAWRMNSGPSRLKVAVLGLFALGTCCAILETTYFSRNMDRLRGAGQTDTAEWRRLHGLSMAVYSGETALLLLAGLLLPSAIARDTDRTKAMAADWASRGLGATSEPARPAPQGIVVS